MHELARASGGDAGQRRTEGHPHRQQLGELSELKDALAAKAVPEHWLMWFGAPAVLDGDKEAALEVAASKGAHALAKGSQRGGKHRRERGVCVEAHRSRQRGLSDRWLTSASCRPPTWSWCMPPLRPQWRG